MILLDLYFLGQSDAFGLIGRSSLAGPYEEFIRVVCSNDLQIAVELIEIIEIAEIVAHAYGWVYAFDLACSEGATEVCILDI